MSARRHVGLLMLPLLALAGAAGPAQAQAQPARQGAASAATTAAPSMPPGAVTAPSASPAPSPAPSPAATSPAVAAPLTSPGAITAVWDVPTACGLPTPEQLARHPRADAIQRSRLVDLPLQKLQFHVPVLPGGGPVVIRIAKEDHSRGVLDQVVVLAPGDASAAQAALVVTDLPRELDSPDRLFDTVEKLQRKLARPASMFPTFSRVDGPYGEALEMVVPGRTADGCFPTAYFVAAKGFGGQASVEISRFARVGGRMVEFALLVPVPATMALGDQQERAKEAMDAFWGGLTGL